MDFNFIIFFYLSYQFKLICESKFTLDICRERLSSLFIIPSRLSPLRQITLHATPSKYSNAEMVRFWIIYPLMSSPSWLSSVIIHFNYIIVPPGYTTSNLYATGAGGSILGVRGCTPVQQGYSPGIVRSLIDWLIDRLIGRLIDWLID